MPASGLYFVKRSMASGELYVWRFDGPQVAKVCHHRYRWGARICAWWRNRRAAQALGEPRG